MINRLLVLLLLLGSPQVAWAQEEDLSLLRLGMDATAGSMGEAQTAYSRDAFSVYWNPAGLAAGFSNSVAAAHQRWVGDVRTYALSTRLRLGEKSSLGAFIVALDGDVSSIRDQLGLPESELGPYAVSVGAGYGYDLGPLYAGLTAKVIREQLIAPATGYAVDVGLQTPPLAGILRLGAALQNIGTTNNREASPLPRAVRAGVAVSPIRFVAADDGTTLISVGISADISHVFPRNRPSVTRLHLGLATEVMGLIILRAGYLSNHPIRQFTFGAGLDYAPFAFDYAYLPFTGGYEQPGHVVTLSYDW